MNRDTFCFSSHFLFSESDLPILPRYPVCTSLWASREVLTSLFYGAGDVCAACSVIQIKLFFIICEAIQTGNNQFLKDGAVGRGKALFRKASLKLNCQVQCGRASDEQNLWSGAPLWFQATSEMIEKMGHRNTQLSHHFGPDWYISTIVASSMNSLTSSDFFCFTTNYQTDSLRMWSTASRLPAGSISPLSSPTPVLSQPLTSHPIYWTKFENYLSSAAIRTLWRHLLLVFFWLFDICLLISYLGFLYACAQKLSLPPASSCFTSSSSISPPPHYTLHLRTSPPSVSLPPPAPYHPPLPVSDYIDCSNFVMACR